MAEWYVAYQKDAATRMHIAPDRGAAIEAALDMLEHGTDVTEVGPLFDSDRKIGGMEIRAIWQEHRATATS